MSILAWVVLISGALDLILALDKKTRGSRTQAVAACVFYSTSWALAVTTMLS